MVLVVNDMSEDPICDSRRFQINMKIMTSAHNRCTKPSSAAVSGTGRGSTHRADEENNKSLVHAVDLELWAHIDFCGAGAVTCFRTVHRACTVLWFLAARSGGHRAADGVDGLDLLSRTAVQW